MTAENIKYRAFTDDELREALMAWYGRSHGLSREQLIKGLDHCGADNPVDLVREVAHDQAAEAEDRGGE